MTKDNRGIQQRERHTIETGRKREKEREGERKRERERERKWDKSKVNWVTCSKCVPIIDNYNIYEQIHIVSAQINSHLYDKRVIFLW